jgi:glutathione synthase/RimK-type ligase-like ATP-grasp enzyme
MDRLQIEYGALDFVVQPDGAWIFLEVNAMGQFLWIEDLTGLNISDEIVEWLENHLNLKKSSL